MIKISLPKDIEEEYNSINRRYDLIRDDWRKYNDEIIPEDKDFAKKIIEFLIRIVDYIIDNYDKLDVKEYQEFLAYYDSKFYYGPSGDDRNYLDFDETIDEESVTEFCWELRDEEKPLTKEKLKEIKTKYMKIFLLLER